jgi:hypothetical protein
MCSYLWTKYGGAQGLPMVPCDVGIMSKDKGGLGLIDVRTEGSILEANWVVKCLQGSSPLQVLLRHRLLLMQHVGRTRRPLELCDIISTPHSFRLDGSVIFKSI